MTKSVLFESIEYIDEKLITEYSEAKPVKQSLVKILLPAACLVLIAVMLPALIKHNAPDREYEARCTRFGSIAEAADVLGNEFAFTKLEDKAFTEITLLTEKGGNISEKRTWEKIEYYAHDDVEMIDISVFPPTYKGHLPSHLEKEPQETVIGNTRVKYSAYEKGSHMSENYFVAAEFEYNESRYEFLFESSESCDKAFEYLYIMLAKEK